MEAYIKMLWYVGISVSYKNTCPPVINDIIKVSYISKCSVIFSAYFFIGRCDLGIKEDVN